MRDVIRPHLGEEWVAFEREPNLRVHFAHEKAPVAPHCDGDHFHNPYEVNLWIPLVDVSGSESLWAESWPGVGDFHPFVARYGEAVRFYGNQAQHFTVDNRTERTRVSLDARVIRGRDVAAARVPRGGPVRGSRFLTEGAARFTLFGYYGIMAADRELEEVDCHDRQLRMSAPAGSHHELKGSPSSPSRPPSLGRSCAHQRSRSPSLEHAKGCVAELGSAREAQRCCARCGWMAIRGRFNSRLSYVNADGLRVPWVAEQPDPHLPWGLGCIPCAQFSEPHGDGAACSFSSFAFGRAVRGRQPLLVKALLRHGNNAAGQCNGTLQIIQRNQKHEEALAAIGGSQLSPEAQDDAARACGDARSQAPQALGLEDPEVQEEVPWLDVDIFG